MQYYVEKIDYHKLVRDMAAAENLIKMAAVLAKELTKLPKSRTKIQEDYFWKALHNASRKNEKVWLWIISMYPAYDAGKGRFTIPSLSVDWRLPIITPDSQPATATAAPKQYPPEQTEKNFQEQANVLIQWFKDNEDPGNRCNNIKEYVATFQGNGTGQVEAMMQLKAYGLNALATPEGVKWLIKTYGTKK